MDKNKAFVDYLLQCPQILNSPLYFNFVNVKNNTNQIVTNSNDTIVARYVDGSVKKRYTYTIITFKSITDIPLVKMPDYSNENIADLADFQNVIDWVSEQQDLHNYPDFGECCQIDDIYSATESPRYDGINTEISPSMAMYSIDIVIDYIDTSKVIWNK